MKTHTHTHHMIHILKGKRDEYIDISKIEWEIKIVIDTKYLKKKNRKLEWEIKKCQIEGALSA